MKHLPFRFILLAAAGLCATLGYGAQSSGSNSQSQSDTSKPPAQSSSQAAAPAQKNAGQDKSQDKSKDAKSDEKDKDSTTVKKKPKKVWTNDEISTVGGTISVVGDSSSGNSANSSNKSGRGTSTGSAQERQIEQYRDQLRQLQAQLDSIDKKINDLRNFKADNSSASGGIDPRHGYSMTPVADQIKQLEDKKKQIQAKIDAVEDEARKKGIEPGQLR